MATTVGLT